MNNNIEYNTSYTGYDPQYGFGTKEPPRTFSMIESVLSWICLFIGYLFCRVNPVTKNPLGGFIFIVLLFLSATVLFLIQRKKIRAIPMLAAVSVVVVSLSLILTSTVFLHRLSFMYALLVFAYFVYAVHQNCVEHGFSNLIAIDFIKALIVLPFRSIHQIFRAMFFSKTAGKAVLKIIAGILLAIVPTAVVLALLSYDNSFSDIINNILYLDLGGIFSHIGSILFGIPVAMYLFGMYISSVDKKCASTFNADKVHATSQSLKVIPSLTAVMAVVPLILVYTVFFISQWDYYLSAFTGVLPKQFSYAEYAREGFFQLCAVSVINLLIIIAISVFMRKSTAPQNIILKILNVIFSSFTLVLISTAFSKMVLYVDTLGLTQKRVYASWFMAVLAIVFVVIILSQFIPRIKTLAAGMAVFAVMFAAIALTNVDGMIAKYNVDRYLDGSLENVDVAALKNLGDPAVPQLLRLYDHIEPTESEYYNVLEILKDFKDDYSEDDNLFSTTIPRAKAKALLREYNF